MQGRVEIHQHKHSAILVCNWQLNSEKLIEIVVNYDLYGKTLLEEKTVIAEIGESQPSSIQMLVP